MIPAEPTHDVLVTLSPLATAEAGEGWLDDGERARLAAITVPLRRRQFLAGHGLARRLAARATGLAPQDWTWRVEVDGRRALRHAAGERLWVSISHSGEAVAAAVARQPLGLDLECDPRPRDWAGLAGRLFEASVAEWIGSDPAAFRQAWALAEADGKRSGRGIQRGVLRRLAMVPVDAGAQAWTWALPGQACLALAAWPGARVIAEGVAGPPRGWCYRPAG